MLVEGLGLARPQAISVWLTPAEERYVDERASRRARVKYGHRRDVWGIGFTPRAVTIGTAGEFAVHAYLRKWGAVSIPDVRIFGGGDGGFDIWYSKGTRRVQVKTTRNASLETALVRVPTTVAEVAAFMRSDEFAFVEYTQHRDAQGRRLLRLWGWTTREVVRRSPRCRARAKTGTHQNYEVPWIALDPMPRLGQRIQSGDSVRWRA